VITRQLVNSALRLAVKRLWDKDVSVEQLRDKAATADAWLMSQGSEIAAVRVVADGVAAEWVGDEAAARRGVLLYLHGGAFCLHLPNGYRLLANRLAQATGMRVLVPDYRLAPEHKFPAALDDCFATYRWLIDQGFPPQRLAIAGDSAGGNLALGVLMRARDQPLPLPACAALMSPITDFSGSGRSNTTKPTTCSSAGPRCTWCRRAIWMALQSTTRPCRRCSATGPGCRRCCSMRRAARCCSTTRCVPSNARVPAAGMPKPRCGPIFRMSSS